ncbi:MAG: YceI family protein [Bacteroidota bacterium]
MKKSILKSTFASVLAIAFVAMASFTAQAQTKVKVKDANIEWEGEKLTGSHNGTVKLSKGHFLMEGDELVGGEFVVDMTTINVTDLEGDNKKDLEGHLKSDDFFGVKKHKMATFKINTVAKKGDVYGVSGDLTIKGKTNPIAFDLKLKDGKATTQLTIDRTNYDVKYGSGSFFDNLGDKTIYDEFDLDITLMF